MNAPSKPAAGVLPLRPGSLLHRIMTSLPPPKPKPRAPKYIPGKTCGRCYASILWGIDEEGRRIALNAQGEPRFVLAFRPDGRLPTVVEEECYVRHRTTCPKAKRPLKSRSTGRVTETHAPNRQPRKAPKPRPS
jgi:hypothetical protein